MSTAPTLALAGFIAVCLGFAALATATDGPQRRVAEAIRGTGDYTNPVSNETMVPSASWQRRFSRSAALPHKTIKR